MSEGNLPVEATGMMPEGSNVVEQLAETCHGVMANMNQYRFDSAFELAKDALRGLEKSSKETYATFEPEEAADFRREIEFVRFLKEINGGLKDGLSRDYLNSAKSFEKAVRIADQNLDNWVMAEDSVASFVRLYCGLAEHRAPLMRACESTIRGAPHATARHIREAESVMEGLLENYVSAASDEQADLSVPVTSFYLGFLVDAAPMYAAIVAQGFDLDEAMEFFETHQPRVRTLLSGQPADVATVLEVLLGVVEAAKSMVEARIALREEKFDAALSNYKNARTLFRKMSRSMPSGLPLSAQIRETCLNTGTMLIPQLEMQVKRERSLVEKIRVLDDKYKGKKRELREARARADKVIKTVAQPFKNFSVQVENITELKTRVNNSLSLNIDLHNKGVDGVIRALDEIGEKIPAQVSEAIRDAAEGAKKEGDLAKKVEKVANVIEAFGKVAETASDFVPYGRTVYRVLRGVFA